MSTTPINEAGIKWPDKVWATFAAIFARLEELEHGPRGDCDRLQAPRGNSIMSRNLDPLDAIDSIFTRLNALAVRSDDVEARLERLESARIATPVAPESAETASEVPMEPGNATDAQCGTCNGDGMLYEDSALVVGVIGGRIAVADCPDCTTKPPTFSEWLNAGHQWVTPNPEVAAALRMYRKVQALTVAEACGIMRVTYELAAPEVTALLAWLKEGEA